jgi:hypothetical protein
MMKPWLELELGRVPPAGSLAEAIRCALARWPALTRFLDDGRIELDNNPVERAIRPIALGRKNHLFAGSDGGGVRSATICSLIATAKLNNVEPKTLVTPARFAFSMKLGILWQSVSTWIMRPSGMPSFSRSLIRRSKVDSHSLLRAKLSSVMKNFRMPCAQLRRTRCSTSSAER